MAQDRIQGNVESLVLAQERIQRNPNPKNALQRRDAGPRWRVGPRGLKCVGP